MKDKTQIWLQIKTLSIDQYQYLIVIICGSVLVAVVFQLILAAKGVLFPFLGLSVSVQSVPRSLLVMKTMLSLNVRLLAAPREQCSALLALDTQSMLDFMWQKDSCTVAVIVARCSRLLGVANT